MLAMYGKLHEDVFWGIYAQNFDKEYRTADTELALKFSFDCFPELCYELASGALPFGCHNWEAHGLKFWLGVFEDNAFDEIQAEGIRRFVDKKAGR
jgi:hypothetical protein